MEENCLICYDKCRPDFNTYLTQNPDLKADVCNLVCEIYKLSNTDLILDLKNYFNFCQLCFDDLTRVHRTFKSLKRLQELLKKDREELDNRIRESYKRFRILPTKNRVINSVRDEIIRNIVTPKNIQTPSESYGFANNEGIIISNEISQYEDLLQSLDDGDNSSPILGDEEEELEIPDVKFSILDDKESTLLSLIQSHTKLKKATLILPRLPESIQEHPNSIRINDPSIQAFLKQEEQSRPPYLKRQQNTIRPRPTYECFFCPMLFNHRGLVIQHKKKDHKDDLYSCSEGFCSAQFSTHQGLKIHQRGVHNIHEYECHFCPEILQSPKELLSHKKIQHPNTIFVCPISSCAREFTKKDTFNNHIQVKHGGGSSEPKFPCTEGCEKVFITKFQLKTHLSLHRSQKRTYPCPFDGCERIFAGRTGRRLHYIKVHKSTLEDLNLKLLLKHGEVTDSNNRKKTLTPRVRRVPKPPKDTIVEKEVKPKAKKPKILSKPRKQKQKKIKGENQIGSWLCEFCSKIFNNKQHLNAHLKHQHPPGGKTSFKCTDCPKSFFYKNSIKDHINQIHLKNFNHYCDQCGLGYYSLPRLNDHRRMHFLTVPCRICPRKFAFTFNRNKHELSHSSEKTFKCTQCPASFKRAISIKNHNITQHSPKDVEPFVCEKCGQKFKLRCNLRRHIILKRCKGSISNSIMDH